MKGRHPVIDHTPTFSREMAKKQLTSPQTQWLGWGALHRFVCHAGHEFLQTPINVMARKVACLACEDEQLMARLHARSAAAAIVCLENEWRGMLGMYRFRCGQGHEWQHNAHPAACPVCPNDKWHTGRRLKDGLQRLTRLARERGGECLSGVYLGADRAHRFRCANGHEWETKAEGVLRGAWCRRCAYQAMAEQKLLPNGLDDLRNAAVARGGVCLSDAYTGTEHRYRFRCAVGHEWQTSGTLIKQGRWCPDCAEASKIGRRMAPDGLQRLQRAAQAKGGACLSETYLGSSKPNRFRCAEGHEWEATGYAVETLGQWCRTCAYDGMRRNMILAHTLAHSRGGQCLSEGELVPKGNLSWVCHRGHFWQTKFHNVQRGHWCPECAHMAKITNKNSKARRRYEVAGQGE